MRPIDADALGKDIEDAYQKAEDENWKPGDVARILCAIIAAPTIDLEPVRWIPVTERLPQKHGGVYACLLKFPGAEKPFPHMLTWHAYGDNGYVSGPHFSDEGLDGLKVTHWMPLPQPPKGVE